MLCKYDFVRFIVDLFVGPFNCLNFSLELWKKKKEKKRKKRAKKKTAVQSTKRLPEQSSWKHHHLHHHHLHHHQHKDCHAVNKTTAGTAILKTSPSPNTKTAEQPTTKTAGTVILKTSPPASPSTQRLLYSQQKDCWNSHSENITITTNSSNSPGHAGVKGNDQADRLMGKATLTSSLLLGRSEVLRSLRHYLWVQSHGHHTTDRLMREVWEEEALDDLSWKDKRGPSSSSLSTCSSQ